MIRVVVADDHSIVRQGLRRVLETAPDMDVVGELAGGDGLADLVREQNAEVVVLDISMTGPDFLELIPAVTAARPGVRVLVLSGHPEEKYAVPALRAGAAGYLSKPDSADHLIEAIRRVHAGRRYVSPTLAEQLAAGVLAGSSGPAHHRLSRRELEVLRLMGTGASMKEIGARIGVHGKTVTTYRTRILQKLGLRTNADLVRYVVTHDLLDPAAARPGGTPPDGHLTR